MNRYGLLGRSLKHSFSPKWFSEKFVREGIEAEYILVESEDVESALPVLKSLRGFNVTIPYKQAIIPFLDGLTEDAQACGAVNCVKRTNEGKLLGHNTDVGGFIQALQAFLGDTKPAMAFVLGTGGSSKAVQLGLMRMGISSETISRANPEASFTYDFIQAQHLQSRTLIINTTPCGMFPEVDALPPLDLTGIDSMHYVMDLIYNPEMTAFLKACQAKGARVENGLRMLYAQAEESWVWWNTP